MRRLSLILLAAATLSCGAGPSEEDCADDEVWVEDACLECGPADGCRKSGPVCAKACESDADCGADPFGCQDGHCTAGTICG